MIEVNIRKLQQDERGSYAELMRARRILSSGDIDAIDALLREIITRHSDATDVEAVIQSLSISDIRAIIEARYGGAQDYDPLAAQSGTT
jgi:hypothetical protein